MRVTLANYTLSMMRGGGETRDLALARELNKLGVEVELLTTRPLVGRVRYPVADIPCRYLRTPYFRDLVYRLMMLPKTGRLASLLLRVDILHFSRRVVEMLSQPGESTDLLQAAGLYPVVAAKCRLGLPVVIRNQGGLPPLHFRHLVARADAIIGDGWDAENFERCLGRPITEIRGGVDLETFSRVDSPLRSSLGLDERQVVLFVGRFAPLKNVSLLLEAFELLQRKLPRARLVLVGEGALEGRLRAQARQFGIESETLFVGAKPLEELPAYYSMADVFALPSSFDNSPNVLLEAMACGLPVVATRVGGVARYVHDEDTGLLVQPGNPPALADALGRLLCDEQLRGRLAKAGQTSARTGQSWATSARQLLSLYESLLSVQKYSTSAATAPA